MNGAVLFGLGGPERRKCTDAGDGYRRAGQKGVVGNERFAVDRRVAVYRTWLDWLADPEHLVAHPKFKGLILDLRAVRRPGPKR